MNFKALFISLLIIHSFTIFAQNSSNPYREFVEKELAKSLEDTATLSSRYIYKMDEAHHAEIKIFPRMIKRDISFYDDMYRNIIYKSNNIGVIWFPPISFRLSKEKLAIQKYRLLALTLGDEILYAKTYMADTIALVPLTENIAKEKLFMIKSCPYESDSENDEALMSKEIGIALHFADSTQQQQIEQDLAKYCNTKNLIMNKLIEAYYCEVNGYLANAIGLYQEVMAAEPNNLHYKKLYKNFLKVTGMNNFSAY